MRRMETAIRQRKDTATLAAAAGNDTLRRECQGSITAMVKEYERVSDLSGMGPDFRRTYVGGFKDVGKGELQSGEGRAIINARGDERMNGIHSPIEQRNTGKGNPGAVEHFGRPLNNRQQRLDDELTAFDKRKVVQKKDVNLRD